MIESQSPKRQIRLEHFQNIVAIAVSDDSLEKHEFDHLMKKGEDLGISRAEINSMIAKGKDLIFKIPLNQEDREEQLAEAVYMAILDGEVHFKEYRLLCQIAERLEMTRDDVDDIIKLSLKLWKNAENTNGQS